MKILKWVALIGLFAGIAVLMGLAMFGFSQQYKKTPEQTAPVSVPESIKNLPIKDIEPGLSIIGQDGISARLQKATLIDGFPCADGDVHFTLSGLLSSCALSEDISIGDNLIPQNTWVALPEDSDYQIYFFPNDTNIQGIPCIGGNYGSAKVPTRFYYDGRLSACYSAYNVTIKGIPCRKTKFGILSRLPNALSPLKSTEIYLNESGSVRRCTLSMEAEINEQVISAGSEIRISADGELTILDDSWKRRTSLWFAGLFGY